MSPEDYERWVLESYAPAARSLPSVGDRRNHRVGGLLGTDAPPPYRYVMALGAKDLERLGRDTAGEELSRLLSQPHGFAEVTQIMADRFV